jgi:hypothetical protein
LESLPAFCVEWLRQCVRISILAGGIAGLLILIVAVLDPFGLFGVPVPPIPKNHKIDSQAEGSSDDPVDASG